MNRCTPFALVVSLLTLSTVADAEEELPEDAVTLIAAYEEDAEAIRAEAEQRVLVERRALLVKLKELQDKYTRAAMLDEAVAVRDRIRALQQGDVPAQPDPGNLLNFQGQVGAKLYFRVTAGVNGVLYGTDVYTADSSLSTAALHAGILKNGETGLVKVTIQPGRAAYASSARNGVTSSAWSAYPTSYSVEKVKFALQLEEKVPNGNNETKPAAVP